MDDRNSIISLETARNGSTVPVVNGIYLHSIYDPEKEAETFVENFEKQFQKKNHVLILGLGFGYHIEQAVESLRSLHASFHITVLEPNKELIKLVESNKIFSPQEVTVLHLESSKKIYESEEFVRFLIKKPSILKHESSFSLNKNAFSDFLTFKSSRILEQHQQQLSERTQNLLTLELNTSFSKSANTILNTETITSRADYLTLALNEIIQTNKRDA